VGTLGFPYIGILQTKSEQAAIIANEEVNSQIPGLVENGEIQPLVEKKIYEVLPYKDIDREQVDEMLATLPEEKQDELNADLKEIKERSTQGALADMAYFPMFMLVCYIGLIVYFKSKGGYKAQVLTGHAAEDDKFTGGVEGAVE